MPLTDPVIQGTSLLRQAHNGPKPLKYVFGFNGVEGPASKQYEHMAKIAVLSARERTTLKLVCVFYGEKNHHMASWFESQGVEVIFHYPTWAEKIKKMGVSRPTLTTYLPIYLQYLI